MPDTIKARVLAAVRSGYCNTTQDIADEIGVPVEQCSSYVSQFASAGIIRKTGRRIPNINPVGRGRPLHVFEVVA